MDETIQEFKNKFNDQQILDAETLRDAVYQLDNQLQNALEEVATTNYKEEIKEK